MVAVMAQGTYVMLEQDLTDVATITIEGDQNPTAAARGFH